MLLVKCESCQRVLRESPFLLEHERQPCPDCGSRERTTFEPASDATLYLSGTGVESFDRGLDGIRLAVLGILVSIGLSVGFGVPADWPIAVAAGLGSFVFASLLIRWSRSRHLMMEFMYRLIGR
jgi:hypothetical protein